MPSKKLKTKKWQRIKKIVIINWIIFLILLPIAIVTNNKAVFLIGYSFVCLNFVGSGLLRLLFNIHLHTKRVFDFYQEDVEWRRWLGFAEIIGAICILIVWILA